MSRPYGRLTRLAIPAASLCAAALAARLLPGADHIDAPATTNDAPADINDVFVFRNPSDPAKLVFALTVNPLIPPAEAAAKRFPTNVLYQWKIDTNGDATEDLVIQARVLGESGQQTLVVRGPAAPATTGLTSTELTGTALAQGRVSGANETFVIEGSGGVRAFAGARDDPFYIDLTRLLDILGGRESAFRNPGVDALAGLNTLALVVELPASRLGAATQLGVWATTSRAN